MRQLPISVIILTKNCKTTIQECVESVLQNNPQEIIVVDGNSSDGTVEIVRRYTDRIYGDEGRGICYARQLGAEMASGEYIFYADSDVVLLPDTLEEMLAELTAKGYGGMTARTVIKGGTGYLGWALARYKNVVSPERAGEKKATIPMKATIFPRELVLKYKVDLSTPNWDDASISLHLIEAGHRLGVSSSYVYHYQHRADAKSLGAYGSGVATAESFLSYIKSPRVLVKYTLLRGLGQPVQGMLVSLAKGEPRLIPYFVYAFLAKTAGFVSGLLRALFSSLRRNKD